jgi:23S rRNA (adenine2503-C2)-methyltransferase
VQNILDLNLEELQQELKPSFRAKQVYLWLHQKLIFNFEEMTDLPGSLRSLLGQKYHIRTPVIKKILKSKDGTKKYLFELSDGNLIESVLLPSKDGRVTICVSTQAGCPLNCSFCATGRSGFKRNLKISEILCQIYLIAKDRPGITNIVFMGMGEPFLNYNNVVRSIRILISKEGLNFGQRKISVSTSGIPEKIRKFADEDWQVRLAVSLNSTDERVRSRLMPVNRRIPITRIKDAIKYYINKTGRRVTLEYVLLKDINDTDVALENLIAFSRGLVTNVNLIPYNSTEGNFHPSDKKTTDYFIQTLVNNKINVNLRRRRGDDILAACGQLAGKVK